MASRTTADFRKLFSDLPEEVRVTAKRAFRVWLVNRHHPGIRYKRVHNVKPIFAARVGLHYRALAVEAGDDVIWFWIGSHAEYDKMLR